MAHIITGTFTIKDVFQLTLQSKFKNRYKFEARDVLRGITINTVKKFNVDRIGAPEVKYVATTSSYPQYKPYINVKGKYSKTQRKVKHQYDIVFETTELSISNKNWKIRLGSAKKIKDAPQSQIQSIYRKNLKVWDKKRIERHRAGKKKYLNNGDWQSQVLGINQDFLYRCEYVYNYFGHLYGFNRAIDPPKITNPHRLMFFPKHVIRFLEFLMQKGVLKE